MREPLFEVPNLDALPREELKELGAILANLSEYALLTARAREHRDAGDISDALLLEAKAEHHYKLLPKEYRW